MKPVQYNPIVLVAGIAARIALDMTSNPFANVA